MSRGKFHSGAKFKVDSETGNLVSNSYCYTVFFTDINVLCDFMEIGIFGANYITVVEVRRILSMTNM